MTSSPSSLRLVCLFTRGAVVVSGALFTAGAIAADLSTAVVGSWRKVSHIATMSGATFDSQAALLKQRPCADRIRYNVNADGTYRLDASASDCEERYKSTQQKLYAQTKWRVVGDTLTVSATDFAVGQSYKLSVSGNRMTWIGTEDEGTVVFQR
jgi:hypothetical protein